MASRNGNVPKRGILPDFLTLNRVASLIDNLSTSRQDLMTRVGSDSRRDIDDECGYPKMGTPISVEEYQQYYDREPIACRVVEVWAKECWQVPPTVFEIKDVEEKTEFENAVDELGKSLNAGEPSWYQDEEGSPVNEILKQADIKSGIGCHGAIYFGLDDGMQPSQPARPRKGQKLLFALPLSELQAKVTRWETDYLSPRWGKPVEYQVNFADPSRASTASMQMPSATKNVHWTRIQHVDLNNNTPRMQSVFNRLYDLRKVYSSDGESYWKQVIAKLFLETHPQLGGDVDVPLEELRDMMESMDNGQQKWAALVGMAAKQIFPQLADPRPHVQVQIEAICIKLEMPFRIFQGSERGKEAASQDDKAWNDRVKASQITQRTPYLVAPFYNRLIQLGVLPTPKGFSVLWPDITSQGAQEKAVVLVQRTAAMSQYVQSGVAQLIGPMDYLVREAGYDEADAAEIIENAANQEPLEMEMDDGGDGTSEGGDDNIKDVADTPYDVRRAAQAAAKVSQQ